jgi:OOP family OmpA-OmpF porin
LASRWFRGFPSSIHAKEEELNTIRMTAIALLALGGLGAAAPQASAQGQLYLGGSLGWSSFDDNNAVPDLITSGAVDGSDSGLKLFGGYLFSENLGLEIAYVDLGKAAYSGTFFGAPVIGGSVDTTGFNFSLLAAAPLNPSFALFGKVGLFAWEANARDTTGGVPFAGKDDGADLSIGLGATYSLNRNVSVRGEWERFKAVGDIDLISIGLAFTF